MQRALSHVPVLLHESLQGLDIKSEGTYVDCTFGRGGHSQLLLEKLNVQGRLFVIDQDPDAVAYAQEYFSKDSRVTILHETFANLKKIAREHHLHQGVDGVFFDLGVSSPQLDETNRGFSFSHDGPLDMRMNTDSGLTAAQWLAAVRQHELVSVLYEFGEERYAKQIARKIVTEREKRTIDTTRQLAELVTSCYPASYKGVHPATRTFQAIRIALNEELNALQKGLDASQDILKNEGRLVVISFHSLEDRIVKRFIRRSSQINTTPAKLPVMPALDNCLIPVGKLIRPTEEEIECNPRARSARLRIARKILK